MLNIALDSVDDSPCAALAIGTDYAFGTMLDTHRHRRAQFLYGMSGLMEVGTDDGAWVVPPYTGVWIPPETPHRVRMNGVSTRSVYVLPQASPRPRGGLSYRAFVWAELLPGPAWIALERGATPPR